jgi:subtilisin family serine protease
VNNYGVILLKGYQIGQKIIPIKSLPSLAVVILILSSILTSQFPYAVSAKEDVDVETSTPSGIVGKYPGEISNTRIENLDNNPNCLQSLVHSITSSGQEDDEDASEAMDGDFETKWSTEELGSYLQLDLGAVKKLCSVDVSWLEEDGRRNNFELSVSQDGFAFRDVLRGSSSGMTQAKERYDFSPLDGRYLRITFYGNSDNGDDATVRELAVNTMNLVKNQTIPAEGTIPLVRDSGSLVYAGNNTYSNESRTRSAPKVSDMHAMVSPAAPFEIIFNASDSDLVDHLTYYIVQLPEYGNLSAGTNSASVRYTPDEEFAGLDNFTYKAVDKYGLASNEATVFVNVNNHMNQSIISDSIGRFQPPGEAILGGPTDRFDLIKTAREPIRGQYIVLLKPNTTTTATTTGAKEMPADAEIARARANEVRAMAEESRTRGAEILNIYEHALDGYVMKTPENASTDLISELRKDPRVASVEPDMKVYAFGQSVPIGVDRVDGDLSRTISGDGRGAVDADIAILDTGIDLNHPDLNVYHEKTFVPGTSSADDDNGHGSHVAGIAAAKDNSLGVVGIAPGARLWAIKVLDSNGTGSISDIIAGIDYVTAHSDEIDVVNLSFGCECSSPALDAAIDNAVNAGIVFVVAAGNDKKDADTFSPANNPNVIAVSAIADSDGKCGGQGPATKYGADDTLASFSNNGDSIDMTAPGVGILSTYADGKYAELTGTSMSAPHVSGSVALYDSSHPGATPDQVKAALTERGITTSSSRCLGEGHGYVTGDPDGIGEPLLNVRDL